MKPSPTGDRSRVRPWIFLLLLCLAPLLAPATAIPRESLPPFSAQYKLMRNGSNIGETHVSLTNQSDQKYVYEVRTTPGGILGWLTNARLRERSSWTLQGDRIRPLEYVYQRDIAGYQRNVRLLFDWRHGTVQNSIEGKTWSMEVPDGTLDKLLVQLALMLDLQAKSQDLEYRIADGGKLKTYRFKVAGRERLVTPFGTFDTLKVERQQESNKRSTVLWCAPALRYLPVRVDQREDGENFSMSIQSLQGLAGAG